MGTMISIHEKTHLEKTRHMKMWFLEAKRRLDNPHRGSQVSPPLPIRFTFWDVEIWKTHEVWQLGRWWCSRPAPQGPQAASRPWWWGSPPPSKLEQERFSLQNTQAVRFGQTSCLLGKLSQVPQPTFFWKWTSQVRWGPCLGKLVCLFFKFGLANIYQETACGSL